MSEKDRWYKTTYERAAERSARFSTVSDMELQPQDIVYVPFSPYRYLQHYAELIVNTFVSSVAINAGTRPLGQPPTIGGAGVFIPVGSGIQVIPPTAPPPIH